MKTIVLGTIAIIILFFANLAWGSVNIPWQDVGGDYFGLSDRRNLPLYSVGIATAGGDCRFAFGRSPRHERRASADSLPQSSGGS